MAGSTEDPGGVDPVEPRPMASNPELSSSFPTSGPSNPPRQEPNGMQMTWARMIPLTIVLPRKADNPPTFDPSPLVTSEGKNEQQGSTGDFTDPGAIDGNKSYLKSLASSTAKLVLRGVKESADAFPLLKTVVGCLCFILDNYEVRRLPYMTHPNILMVVPENDRMSPSDRIV